MFVLWNFICDKDKGPRAGALIGHVFMEKIRLLLADDHTLFRQGIRALVSAEPDMEVVGEAANGGDAVDKAAEARPDVVLMDIGMAGLSSFEATRQIKKNRRETKVVFLTMYDDENYLFEGLEVGASGYVLKDIPSAQLVAAVRDICRDGAVFAVGKLGFGALICQRGEHPAAHYFVISAEECCPS